MEFDLPPSIRQNSKVQIVASRITNVIQNGHSSVQRLRLHSTVNCESAKGLVRVFTPLQSEQSG